MVEEAQELRARVLADLARRRKVLHAQIEQLRAGRERLTETVDDVRRSVDAIAEDLFAAEDNARVAAEAAGRAAADRAGRGNARRGGRCCSSWPHELRAVAGDDGRGEDEADGVDEAGSAELAGGETTGRIAGVGDRRETVDALFAKAAAPANGRCRLRSTRIGLGRDGSSRTTPPRPDASSRISRAGRRDRAAVGSAEPAEEAPADEERTNRPTTSSRCRPSATRSIEPIVTALSRRLKRTLQDSQNDLLDSLRSQGSTGRSRSAPRGESSRSTRAPPPRSRCWRRRPRPV